MKQIQGNKRTGTFETKERNVLHEKILTHCRYGEKLKICTIQMRRKEVNILLKHPHMNYEILRCNPEFVRSA